MAAESRGIILRDDLLVATAHTCTSESGENERFGCPLHQKTQPKNAQDVWEIIHVRKCNPDAPASPKPASSYELISGFDDETRE
jgi:hypothetical protein